MNSPRKAIWHGSTNGVVIPANADESVLQWSNANGVRPVPTTTQVIGAATVERYSSLDGAVRVESWRVAKMTHGAVVDPKNGCGAAGAFMLDVGLCSTKYAAEFFGLTTGGGLRRWGRRQRQHVP